MYRLAGASMIEGPYFASSENDTLVGSGAALFSAFMYGIYTTLLKMKAGDDDRLDSMLFFGYIGLLSLIMSLPIFAFLHFTSLEAFSWPQDSAIWWGLVSNGLISVFSDYLWARSILLTTPLVATIGT